MKFIHFFTKCFTSCSDIIEEEEEKTVINNNNTINNTNNNTPNYQSIIFQPQPIHKHALETTITIRRRIDSAPPPIIRPISPAISQSF